MRHSIEEISEEEYDFLESDTPQNEIIDTLPPIEREVSPNNEASTTSTAIKEEDEYWQVTKFRPKVSGLSIVIDDSEEEDVEDFQIKREEEEKKQFKPNVSNVSIVIDSD